MKKIVSFILAVTLILTACSSGTANEGDGKLIVWGFYEGAPKLALDYYAEETGKEVEYVTIGWEDYQTKLNTVLGTSEAPDIVLLERSFMGNYLASDNFVSIEEQLSGEENFEQYKENTALATMGPGIIEDQVKAIGWENTSAGYFYRADIAKQCLGINNVEEMEAAIQTKDDLYGLFDKMQASNEGKCNETTLFGFPDYQTGLLQQTGIYEVDGTTYTITKEFKDVLDEIKENNQKNMVYSPQNDKTQITAANQSDLNLGNYSAAWGTQVVLEYDQPDTWSVAEGPLSYSLGGSFIAITSNADLDLSLEFLNMTFLNEQWIIDNMDSFGMVGNETITSKYLETTDGTNEYFYEKQNTVQKFSDINSKIDYYVPVTPYDSGIGTSVEEVLTAYTQDMTVATSDEAAVLLQDKVESLYPDLEVIVEE